MKKNNKLDVHVQVARWRCSPSDADCIVTLYITTLRRCIKNAKERVSAVIEIVRRNGEWRFSTTHSAETTGPILIKLK